MKTIKNVNIDNKNVIIRCDLNVPIENGIIKDETRIIESLPTLKYVIERANKVIILSHLGRIKSKEDLKNNSLLIVCNRLKELLNLDIAFYNYEDNKSIVDNNKIIMFENTRYFDIDNKKESNNDLELARYFSSFGDIFINDAFGVSHRNCASLTGISEFLDTYAGFLVEKEVNNLQKIKDNPDKPFTVILGGAKVKDKIGVIENLISKTDKLVIVGAMAFTFLKAQNIEVGKSIVDTENLEYAKNLLENYSDKIILPKDAYVSKEFSNDSSKILKNINDIKVDDIALDIGPETIKYIYEEIKESKTIFLNGPAGAFELENYEYGTKELLDVLTKIKAFVVIGGGDSAYAAVKFGYKDKFNHISTGGGAALEYLEGKVLPGIKIIL
jgi:phosphoglycerate kinase